MSERRVYDIGIIGAGVSGLLLAWRMMLERPDYTIVLIDGARDDDMLRTLSFWKSGEVLFEHLIRHRWKKMELYPAKGEAVELTLTDYEYCTLFFADLQREVKQKVQSIDKHTIIEGRVSSVDHLSDEGCVELSVKEQKVYARWVFDSRFKLRDFVVNTQQYHDERQYIHGWVLKTNEPVFRNFTPRFMDFRSKVSEGRVFYYVLPFSETEALVELVTLDSVDEEAFLHEYIREHLGITEFTITDREAGISPMTEQPFEIQSGARVRNIGIPSGALKATTGYAFSRILDDLDNIFASMDRSRHPFVVPKERGIFRWMDGVLLELWGKNPKRLSDVFRVMFARNSVDRIFRFLDERVTFRVIVSIALTLPAWLFIITAVQWTLRRVRWALSPRS